MTSDRLAGLLHLDAALQGDDIEDIETPQAAKLDIEAPDAQEEEEEEEEEGKHRPVGREHMS